VEVRFPMKGSSFATTSNMGKRTHIRENSIDRGITSGLFQTLPNNARFDFATRYPLGD